MVFFIPPTQAFLPALAMQSKLEEAHDILKRYWKPAAAVTGLVAAGSLATLVTLFANGAQNIPADEQVAIATQVDAPAPQ